MKYSLLEPFLIKNIIIESLNGNSTAEITKIIKIFHFNFLIIKKLMHEQELVGDCLNQRVRPAC